MALALDVHSGSGLRQWRTCYRAPTKMDQAMESRQPNNHKSWTATKSRNKNNRRPERREDRDGKEHTDC